MQTSHSVEMSFGHVEITQDPHINLFPLDIIKSLCIGSQNKGCAALPQITAICQRQIPHVCTRHAMTIIFSHLLLKEYHIISKLPARGLIVNGPEVDWHLSSRPVGKLPRQWKAEEFFVLLNHSIQMLHLGIDIITDGLHLCLQFQCHKMRNSVKFIGEIGQLKGRIQIL